MPYSRFSARVNGVDKNNASDVNVLNVGLGNATAGIFNVFENGAVGDGVTDDSSKLTTTDSSNGGTGVTHLPSTTGGYAVGNSITLSHPTHLPPGAKFKPASGKTLTLNGNLDAGPYQIFDLSAGGTVALGAGSCKRAYAEWWGAAINAANDSTSANLNAFNAAITACAAAKIPLHVTGSVGDTWVVKGQVTARSNMYLEGDGATLKLDTALSGTPSVIGGASGLSNIHIRNLVLDGGASTYTETDRQFGVFLLNVSNFLMHECTFQNIRYDPVYMSGQDITIERNRVLNAGRHGMFIETGAGVTTDRVTIRDNKVLDWARIGSGAAGAYGIVAIASAGGVATGDNITISRNHVELQTGSAGAGSCIYAAGGQSGTDGHTYTSKHLKIDGNRCLNAGLGHSGFQGAGIEIAFNCPDFTCIGNTVDGSVWDGISYGAGTGSGANDATITGGIIADNVVTGCLGATGIEVEGTNIAIRGNSCIGNSGHGIFVAGVNTTGPAFVTGTGGHTVAGNTCWANGDNGIVFVNCPNTAFLGNVCANNNTAAGGFAGIKFQTNAAALEVSGCFFDGNQCFDTRSGGSRTQSYGIDTSASSGGSLCDGNRFGVNDCHNNTTNDILLCVSPTTPDVLAPRNRKAALAFAANPTFDPASYDEFAITLTGNITTPTIARGGDGEIIRVALTQDATGGRTMAWPSSFSFPAATAPTLSGASKTDVFSFQYDFAAAKWRQIAAAQNMS